MTAWGTDLGRKLGQRVCPVGHGLCHCLPLASLGCLSHCPLREFFRSQTLLKLGVHLSNFFELASWWLILKANSFGRKSFTGIFCLFIWYKGQGKFCLPWAFIFTVKQSWEEICLVNLTAWNKSLKIKQGSCLIFLSKYCALRKYANAVLDVGNWECISQWTLNVE